MTRRPARRTLLVAAGVLVALTGAGAGTWAVVGDATGADTATQHRTAHATSTVTKGDLTDAKTFSGTLGYGTAVPLPATAHGTLTWLPEPGSVVHRDQPLYAVDERPVRALHGRVPLWRPLERGVSGEDVAQLNQNLAALGHDVALDDVFGPRTQRAVRAWQRTHDLPVTGVLDGDQVAFVDGDVRVDGVTGQLGAPAGGDVLSLTSTKRVVTAVPPEQDAERLAVGTSVTVRVNGVGDPMPGTVIDSRPTKTESGGAAVEVTIAFESGDRDLPAAATAQVVATGRQERGVLSVPVAALVAGPGDGFAVDVVRRDGTTKRVSVDVGFVAAGRAAVTGAVHEGDQVVVPS